VRKRRRGVERKIARERIDILFRLAEEEALRERLDRADRYCQLARRIGMRYNVPLPSRHKRRICKGCHSFLLPSVTAQVRVRRGRVVMRCMKCGKISRFPYIREQRSRRRGSQGV